MGRIRSLRGIVKVVIGATIAEPRPAARGCGRSGENASEARAAVRGGVRFQTQQAPAMAVSVRPPQLSCCVLQLFRQVCCVLHWPEQVSAHVYWLPVGLHSSAVTPQPHVTPQVLAQVAPHVWQVSHVSAQV